MNLRAHNDTADLAPADGDGLTVAVVIPVFNRPELLARTLAGFARVDPVPRIVVADDGSTADIGAVVETAPLDVTLVRQKHDGYGAGRARNLGAAHAGDVDVLVFVDADCIPHPGLVRRHLAWHAAHQRLVTIGDRRHAGVGDLTPEKLAGIDLEQRVTTGFSDRPDFRRVLGRRTSDLRVGDEAFRTFVSSNVALRRSLFEEVGGFDPSFRRWGGEDTELGWRLWQAGAFFRPVDDAVIYHQLDEDESGGHAGRSRSRHLNDGTIASLIPHSFYRKPRRDVIYRIPKVSVVAHNLPDRLDDLWSDVSSQTAPDFELLLVGAGDGHQPLAGLLAGDPRVSLHHQVGAAIDSARGELVVTLDGSVALDHRFLARITRHFHDRPTTSSLTVGYTLPSDPIQAFVNQDDAEWIDSRWRSEVPLVTVTRRRDWAKAAGMAPAEAWKAIRRLDRPDHLAQGLAWVPAAERAPRPTGFVANRPTRAEMVADLKSHPLAAPRTVARIVRARTRGVPYSLPTAPTAPDPSPETSGQPVARYVGWVGYDNLGDEAMLTAARHLLPWASVEVSGTPRNLLLLGGGTLINRRTYLGWLQERDSPRIERAVLGTGVASPEFWGVTEPIEEWKRWLRSCAYVGVRGPHSKATLRDWDFAGDIEVCGDLALLFERPAGTETEEDLVVVSPAWTNGELWGGSDDRVMEIFTEFVGRRLSQGQRVAFLSCNPADDRPIFEIIRSVGRPDLEYLAGYRNLADSLRLLARSGLVVGERLHAVVLAAAVGSPFVAVEYRPKVGDFAASVDAEAALVRTDRLTSSALEEAAAAADGLRGVVAERVDGYRRRLRQAGEVIREAVES